MKTKVLLIALVAGLTFTSCEKCKDCTIAYETINGFDISELDSAAVILGHADFGSFYMDEIFDGMGDEPESACPRITAAESNSDISNPFIVS
jgi:hypothetical protein